MTMTNEEALKKILNLMLSLNDDRTAQFVQMSIENINKELVALVEARIMQISQPAVPDAVYYNPYSEGGVVRHSETWENIVPFTAGLSHHGRIVQLTELQPYAHDVSFWKKSAIALAGGLDMALKGKFDE